MSDVLALFIFIVGYYALMKWVLPYFGVQTCLRANYHNEFQPQTKAARKSNSRPPSFD